MKRAIQQVNKVIEKAGKSACSNTLLPAVKKWMKRNNFSEVIFINGRGWVVKDGTQLWPDDMKNVKVANEFIDLCNLVGYERGYYLPTHIVL